MLCVCVCVCVCVRERECVCVCVRAHVVATKFTEPSYFSALDLPLLRVQPHTASVISGTQTQPNAMCRSHTFVRAGAGPSAGSAQLVQPMGSRELRVRSPF